MISRFKDLYDALWSALYNYTLEVAQTEQSRFNHKKVLTTQAGNSHGESPQEVTKSQSLPRKSLALHNLTSKVGKIFANGRESDSVRDAIQAEITKLAGTISQIESNFSNIKRVVQKIDAQQVIRVGVASELKAYLPEWIKLHDVPFIFDSIIYYIAADILHPSSGIYCTCPRIST